MVLDDESCGLRATLAHQLPRSFLYSGDFVGENVSNILDKMAASTEILPSIIGAAIINALLKVDERTITYGNLINYLNIHKEDVVGMVGAILPLIPAIRNKTEKIYVFDRYPIDRLKEYCPDWKEPIILPDCSIVIISGTAVFNRTLDQLIPYLNNAKHVALVGPTTPLIPEIFKKYKIDIISGVKILNSKRVLRIVSQGGGTRDFGNSVKQVNIFLKR
ncbi:hypothetical protein ES703_77127 [subsurface metagenome]